MIDNSIIKCLPFIPLPEGMSYGRFVSILKEALEHSDEFLCVRIERIDMVLSEYVAILNSISNSIEDHISLSIYLWKSFRIDCPYPITLRDVWITKNIEKYTQAIEESYDEYS